MKNFIKRHKIWTTIIAVVILFVIIGAFGNKGDNTPSTDDTEKSQTVKDTNGNNDIAGITTEPTTELTDSTAEETAAPTEPAVTTYSNGKYLVDQDIPSGLYRVRLTDTLTKMGYIERSKDLNMEVGSIIANIILTGDGYVEILDSDVAVKLQGVEIEPIDIKDLEPNIKEEATDGIYLINYDLKPGTYKVEVTDTITNMGYVERSKSVAMGINDIIANEIIQGPSYLEIKESDYAVRLQGVKITLQK